ncbi:hypothetical protein [Streptomyces sp. NRRL F-5123]|uniref:hypothetical protein n=1 Tax=Streptomyces sp. NRRL F-5123 TaxID=1463856 RepID=UPI00131AD916|nr:hypothetical protein [Streptomyces sp. NRRL F-5123]
MADGTRKAIEDVRVGDRGAATDPVDGRTVAEPVTALVRGDGDKDVTDVTVAGQTVTATDGHPFRVPDTGA